MNLHQFQSGGGWVYHVGQYYPLPVIEIHVNYWHKHVTKPTKQVSSMAECAAGCRHGLNLYVLK